MGHTQQFIHVPVKEWFKSEFESNGKYTVLDSALVNRSVLYGAVKDNETNEVFATVYTVSFPKNDSYGNFMYKDMDETVGPCYYDMPQNLFKLLTPTDNEFALGWRRKVEKQYQQKKVLKSGDCIVKTDKPVKFSNGWEFQHFIKVGKKVYGGTLENNRFVLKGQVRFNFKNYDCEFLPVDITTWNLK